MTFDPHYRILRSIVADPEGPDQELVTDFKVESINTRTPNHVTDFCPLSQSFRSIESSRGRRRRKNTGTWIHIVRWSG